MADSLLDRCYSKARDSLNYTLSIAYRQNLIFFLKLNPSCEIFL